MSDTKDMNDRLRYLADLYDGDAAAPEDADAAREMASFREMKALLDARPKQTPDASVVSAVLAAARGESVPQRLRATDDRPAGTPTQAGPRGRRGDRLPVARGGSTVLRIGAASALVVLLLAVVGILHLEILGPATQAPGAETSISSAERAAPGDEREERALAQEERRTFADAGQDRAGAVPSGSTAEATPRSGVDAAPSGSRAASKVEDAAPPASVDRDARGLADVQQGEDERFDDARARHAAPGSRSVAAATPEDRPESSASLTESFGEKAAFERRALSAQAAASRAVANSIVPTGRSTADVIDAQSVSWDERADVLEVYQHIEMIGSGVEQGWEPPSVPLEMLPQQDGGQPPDLHPAGERRNPNP